MLGRGHAEHLVPMIAALPEKGRADRIAVALGPGSFTGVRVGIAAARALAMAWNAALIGYPTLDLVAAMAGCGAADDEVILVAMTGGHSEWFVQSFGRDGQPLAAQSPLQASRATAARVAGSQAEALVALRGYGQAMAVWPDARAFACLPQSAIRASAQPIYGRAPDARLPAITLPTAGPPDAADH